MTASWPLNSSTRPRPYKFIDALNSPTHLVIKLIQQDYIRGVGRNFERGVLACKSFRLPSCNCTFIPFMAIVTMDMVVSGRALFESGDETKAQL